MSGIEDRAVTRARTVTTPWEAIGIGTLCFGWFIYTSLSVVSAGYGSGGTGGGTAAAFSNAAFIGLIVFELVVGGIALYILRARGFSVASLYPAPSVSGAAIGALLYIAAAFAGWIVTAPFYSAAYTEPIRQLMPRPGGIDLATLVAMGLVNGTYEEVFLLGFLMRGLRGYGFAAALGVSLLVRLLYHLYQGPLAATSVFIYGAVVSLYFASSGRLFPAVFAHALADIVPFIGMW